MPTGDISMIELYKNRELMRSICLDLGKGYIFTQWNVKEDVKLRQAANVGDDYTIGSFVSSELEFNVIDMNSAISETALANQSFDYKMGIEANRVDLFSVWELQRPELFCMKDDIVYGVKGGIFIAYSSLTGEIIADIEQPHSVPQCVIIVEDKLYCGNAKQVDEYSIVDTKPAYVKTLTLNGFESENVAYLIKHNRMLLKKDNFITEYEFDYFNMVPISLIGIKSSYTNIGRFIVTEAKRVNGTTVKIRALDYGSRFNQIIDNVLNKLKYPITPFEACRQICNYFEVGLKSSALINQDFKLETTIKSKNITGRSFVQWTAELYSCVAIINSDNELEFLEYKPIDYTLTPNDYFKPPTVFEYETQKINKLVVEIPTKNDIAEVDGGQNVYRIKANPFFITDSESKITPYLVEIYAKLKAISYRPYEVRCVGNPYIKVGDIISVETLEGNIISAYVMERVQEGVFGLCDTYIAVGKINRIETASQSAQTESLVTETIKPDESADKYISDVNSSADISIGTTATERALLMVLSKDAHVFLNVLMTSVTSTQGIVTIAIKLGGVLFYTYKQAIQPGDFTIGFEFPLWQISKGENRVSIEISSTVPFVISKYNFNMWLRSKGIIGGKSDKYPAINVTEPIEFMKFADSVTIALQVPKAMALPDVAEFIEFSDEVGTIITESEVL